MSPDAVVLASGIERAFAGRDFLNSLSDDQALLALRLQAAPDLRAVQYLAPTPASWTIESAQCKVLQGPPFLADLDQPAFHLITLCRGQAPLGAVLQEVARRVGQPAEQVIPAGLAAARRMIDQGCLVTET
jgi:hypothetical protein